MGIAIIGAGLAGLTAARALVDAGYTVDVFDKGRGPGGRIATRRTEFGPFDHGAPVLHDLPSDTITAGSAVAFQDGYIGAPKMSSFPRSLAYGLNVTTTAEVAALVQSDAGWELTLTDGTIHMAENVLVCIPPIQARRLIPAPLHPDIENAKMAAVWTTLCAFDGVVPGPDEYDLSDDLKALRMSARPGRDEGERWVIHATADWTATRLDLDRDDVAKEMTDIFINAAHGPAILYSTAHRWLYGRTATPLGVTHLWDKAAKLGVAGDWMLGEIAGHAVQSGNALAQAVARDTVQD